MANLEDGLSKPILKRTGGKLPTHLEPTYRGEGGVHARKQGDRVRHFATATALVLWLGAVAVGMVMLWQYSMSPGTPAKAPPTWPAQSKIPLSRDKRNLVMAVHPRCPCSRASIGELAVLMARTGSPIAASGIFVRGSGLYDQWARTDQWAKADLWRSSQAILRVATLVDDGREALRFRAPTSTQ